MCKQLAQEYQILVLNQVIHEVIFLFVVVAFFPLVQIGIHRRVILKIEISDCTVKFAVSWRDIFYEPHCIHSWRASRASYLEESSENIGRYYGLNRLQ